VKGTVFSVEEFSVYDGPGIRTSVFLKGCPLRCTWCHNPEGQERTVQIVRSPNGCTGCGNCMRYAETVNGSVRFTEDSIAHCPNGLLRYCGEIVEANALCEKLLKNSTLLRNGGVTFSGGEPLAQAEFVFECLSLLKGKLHTAIQTCGYCSAEVFAQALSLCDYMLFDVKIADDTLHRRYTGVSNANILANLTRLANSGLEFVVRIPLIPGVSDTADNLQKTCEILKANGVDRVELLPYNQMAGGKYKMLNRAYEPAFDTEAAMQFHTEIFERYCIQTTVL